MASELSREDVIGVVDRILRGIITGDEAEQWLALSERTLGLRQGALVGRVYYPEEMGLPEDTTAEELVASATVEGE
jgi:hypothetical protein